MYGCSLFSSSFIHFIGMVPSLGISLMCNLLICIILLPTSKSITVLPKTSVPFCCFSCSLSSLAFPAHLTHSLVMMATGGGCRNLFLFYFYLKEFEGCLSLLPNNAEDCCPCWYFDYFVTVMGNFRIVLLLFCKTPLVNSQSSFCVFSNSIWQNDNFLLLNIFSSFNF